MFSKKAHDTKIKQLLSLKMQVVVNPEQLVCNRAAVKTSAEGEADRGFVLQEFQMSSMHFQGLLTACMMVTVTVYC